MNEVDVCERCSTVHACPNAVFHCIRCGLDCCYADVWVRRGAAGAVLGHEVDDGMCGPVVRQDEVVPFLGQAALPFTF